MRRPLFTARWPDRYDPISSTALRGTTVLVGESVSAQQVSMHGQE